jgi:acetyl esterase/lipase
MENNRSRLVAALGSLLVGSCSVVVGLVAPAPASASAMPPTAPRSVYLPPAPLPERPAGTLIWAEKVELPLHPPAAVWRMLYHSRDVHGRDVAVSGFAIVPPRRPGRGGRAVYAWAHGSAGQADRCAPSRDLRANLPPYGGQLVGANVALVATDYDGLGTPGTPTPGVGVAEGRAVLDSVRALAQLPNSGKTGPVVIAGESQGGGAALWAAQLAASYAPRLDVRGVAAFAPAAQLSTIVRSLRRPPYSASLGEVLWYADGLRAAYGGRAQLARVLTRQARQDLGRVENECAAQTLVRWRRRPETAVFAVSPMSLPKPFVSLLHASSPGAIAPKSPILLIQGSSDEVIPPAVTAQLKARYCSLGANVARRLYPGANHEDIVDAATDQALAWISDRFKGRRATSDC